MWTLDGRYRLEHRIGAGGMSVVWYGYDQVLNRPVAVKLLRTGVLMERRAHERVRAEARAAARLAHPNVASVYDFGRTRVGRCWVSYLVMELLDGETLGARLRGGPLDWHVAARICAQVAAGLSASHARGIVHRDVKPANVVLTSSGAKVVDFGIAAAIGQPETSRGGKLIGTPAYVAPERLRGEAAVPGTDVYAVGLLLYHCLTGRLPWRADTAASLITAHLELEPEPLPKLPGVPEALGELCSQCLRKSPSDRPTARRVALTLMDLVRESLANSVPLRKAVAPEAWDSEVDTVFQAPATAESARELPPPRPPRVGPAPSRRAARQVSALATLVAIGVLSTTAASVPEALRPAGAGRGRVVLGPGPAAAGVPRHKGTMVGSTPACRVGYTIDQGQGGQITATVTVVTDSGSPASGWLLTFQLPAGRYVAGVRDADWSQTGRDVALHSEYPWSMGNRLVVTFDTVGNPEGDPEQFVFNGLSCGSLPQHASGDPVDGGGRRAPWPRWVAPTSTVNPSSPQPEASASADPPLVPGPNLSDHGGPDPSGSYLVPPELPASGARGAGRRNPREAKADEVKTPTRSATVLGA